jgi:hypothetical protein
MITRRAAVLLTVTVIGSGVAGCGSSNDPGIGTGQTASTIADPGRQLEAAVEDAIRRNHTELVDSLWTNRVPTHPVATAGPALRQLRLASDDRRRSRVRVRSVSQHLRILRVRLDPSYRTATALVRDDQRVQLVRYGGRPIGKERVAHERVRLVLRRVPGDRFVVWRVERARR